VIACGATTDVTAREWARPLVSARQGDGAARLAGCELGGDHDGSHVAFLTAAEDGERWWWLRWGPQTRELVHVDPCAVVDVDEAYQDDCFGTPSRTP
jgi:hypothetical protein